MSETSLRVTYQLTKDEFLNVMKFHFLQDRKKIWALYAILFIFLVVLNWPLSSNIPSIISSILVVIFSVYFLIPFVLGRQFKKTKLLKTVREMAFQEDGFSLKTTLLDVFIKYQALERVRGNNEFIILYLSSNSFHFIPLRALENKHDFNKLRDILQKNVSDSLFTPL